MHFGRQWARHSRLKQRDETYRGESEEPLVRYAKTYLQKHPDIDIFIFGHRHIELDLMLSHSSRLIILGDCFEHYTYGVLDDGRFCLDNYS